MLKSFTFGCGQGATKAMMQCIKDGIIDKNNCCVINSTKKDIPEDYLGNTIIISDDPDAGCGKVREAARVLMFDFIKNNNTSIDVLLEDVDYVNIIATTEGASGSGASVILARYIKQELEIPVIITIITGFESDTRGLQNTINYFKDLQDGDFIVRTVSNKKYLDKANNTFAAEKLANKDISRVMSIIETKDIIDSDQNIDDTDLFKLITNPGLMFAGEIIINTKIKNPEQIEKMISDMIDYSSSLDFEPSANKIGIFMNVSEDTLMNIDTNFTSIKNKLCSSCLPELFIHKQFNNNTEFIRVIATGIKLPTEELMNMYNKYRDNMDSINNNVDTFFDTLKDMDTVNKNKNFNNTNSKNSFFEQFDSESKNTEESTVIGRNKRKRRFSTHSDDSSVDRSKYSTSISYNEDTDSINKF